MKKIALFCSLVASATALADWCQTGEGTYDYNDSANWSDGTPNGVFPETLTLTGAQTITFAADTALPNGLTVAYKGNFPMTFVSDGTGAKTLTLGDEATIVCSTASNGKAAHVTFGSATADENLIFDLGAKECVFSAVSSSDKTSDIGWLLIYAKMTNGGVKYSGKGTIKVYGENDYADGTYLAHSGYLYLNNNAALGTGLVTVDASSHPRLHGDSLGGDGLVLANDWLLNGQFNFHGAKARWTGTLIIPSPILFWCESDGLTIASPAFVTAAENGSCALANFHKFGSKQLRVETPFSDENLEMTVGNGTWNQYGKLTGQKLTVYGDSTNTSNTGHLHLYGENELNDRLALASGNLYVYLNHAQAIGATTTVYICATAVLCADKFSVGTLLENHVIEADSTGTVALGQNETADFDLSGTPYLRLGANGADRTITGTLTPNAEGVYRLGGGGKSLLLNSENAVSGPGIVEIYGNNVILNQANPSFTGAVKVFSSLELKGDVGSLANASVVDVYGGTLFINSSGKAGARRAAEVHLHGGILRLTGNNGAATTDTIDKLVVDVRDPAFGTVGGTPQILLQAGSKTANLQVGEFIRRNDVIWRLGGNLTADKRLRIGGEEGTNTARFTVGNSAAILDELRGGGGAADTPAVSVYPFAYGVADTYYDTFVTYTEADGFRGLDFDTEYETTLPVGEQTAINVRVPNGTTMDVASDTTINALLLTGSDGKVNTVVSGSGTLGVSSVIMGYHRNAQVRLNCTLDFGDRQGVVGYARGKPSYANCALKGSAGAIFYQYAEYSSSGSSGSGLVITAQEGSVSTLTGDIVVHGYLTVSSAGVLPGGEGRRGDIYVHGHADVKATGQCYDGISGIGYIFRRWENLSIGGNNATGDLAGAFIDTGSLTKIGTGRQRVAGTSSISGGITVEAGVLQNDGTFTASAVAVKPGATLGGSGAFDKLVTLEDGASLEVGSRQTGEQVLSFNAGLTLKGAAELNLVYKDRMTVGRVAVQGAVTTADENRITVNVLAADDETLRGGVRHVVLTAALPLNLSNFKRGAKCGHLSLSEDGLQLFMDTNTGLRIVIR